MKSSRTDEGFQLQLGTTLKSRLEPYHRCLIVSDPQGDDGYVVLVRITTDDGKWPDRDCILTRADWREMLLPLTPVRPFFRNLLKCRTAKA